MKRRSFLRLLGSTALAAWVGPVQVPGPVPFRISNEDLAEIAGPYLRRMRERVGFVVGVDPASGIDTAVLMEATVVDDVVSWAIVTDS